MSDLSKYLEFENDEDEITNNIFPNDNDTYEDSDTDSDDSDDSSNGGSVDLGLADDLKESDSAMQCVLELEDVVNDLLLSNEKTFYSHIIFYHKLWLSTTLCK